MTPPIRHELTLAADPARAFEVFAEEMVGWWPLAKLNVLGLGSLVSFEADLLIERTVDGGEAVWGEVREWEPARRLRLSWHPGTPEVTEITVTFDAADAGTHVTLEHSGWEAYTDPAAARAEYEPVWPLVLETYRAQADAGAEAPASTRPATGTEPGETWVALMHAPGPSAPTDGPLFADPRFAEHVAFLQRMSTRGYLVAAGPLTDADGSGMTVLRLPGPDRLDEVTQLATVDDLAVASGLLTVSLRRWNVLLHGLD